MQLFEFLRLSSKFVSVPILFICLISISFSVVSAADEGAAIEVIDQAEVSLALGYGAVLEAEQAGANVSLLLDGLNIAGEHLAEAKMLFRLGDFDGSIYSADLALEQLGGDFVGEAEQLKIDAQESGSQRWVTNIAFSVVGVIAVFLGTYLAWLIFKKYNFSKGIAIERGGKT